MNNIIINRQSLNENLILGDPGADSWGEIKINNAAKSVRTKVYKNDDTFLSTFVRTNFAALFIFILPQLSAHGSPRM